MSNHPFDFDDELEDEDIPLENGLDESEYMDRWTLEQSEQELLRDENLM
jgi:hypothetical protein